MDDSLMDLHLTITDGSKISSNTGFAFFDKANSFQS